jgi:putative transposase
MRPVDLAGLAFLATVWGTSFLFVDVALTGVNPGGLVASRLAIGGVVLVLLARLRRVGLPRRASTWAYVVGMSLVGQAAPFLLFAWAQLHVSIALAGIYTGATPLLTIPVAWVFLRQRPTSGEAVAAVVGFVGIGLVLSPWTAGSGSPVGQVLCLAGATCYALGYAYASKLLSQVTEDKFSLAAAQAVAGSLLMLPVLAVGGQGKLHLTGAVCAALTALGVGSAAAFVCNYWLIARVGPLTASLAFYLIPVVATVTGYLARRERLSGHEIAGCLTVVGALGVLYVWPLLQARNPTPATTVVGKYDGMARTGESTVGNRLVEAADLAVTVELPAALAGLDAGNEQLLRALVGLDAGNEQLLRALAGLDAGNEQLLRVLAGRMAISEPSQAGGSGFVQQMTKLMLEAGREAAGREAAGRETEMTARPGYGRHAAESRNGGDSRNTTRTRTVITGTGPVDVDVPRDRAGTFAPVTVTKGTWRLRGADSMVISLVARGMSTGQVRAHLAGVYGISVSRKQISDLTDAVVSELGQWRDRPLDPVYPVIFIDVINVRISDGRVADCPVYVASAVTVDGERDVLGLWVGEHSDGEGAQCWLVLTEIKNRGVQDVCMIVCGGPKHLSAAVAEVWPRTVVQACIAHLLGNSFRCASRKDWAAVATALRPVYTAASQAEAGQRFREFAESDLGRRYPAIVWLWEDAWAEMVPFLAFDREIRKIIYTAGAIESLSSRYWRTVNARVRFPDVQAAVTCLYLTTMSSDPTGRGRRRRTSPWQPVLSAFDSAFDGRLTRDRSGRQQDQLHCWADRPA